MSTFPPPALRPIVAEVAGLLKERGESVCVAETAAGGIISATLLSTPGASSFYKGGLTVYTLPSRLAYADWTDADMAAYNGPTPRIVAGLAASARARLGATYAIGESGTAGPTGGATRARTPGYAALAVVGPTGTATREVETGHNRREENMVRFAEEALVLLRDVLRGDVEVVGE